jgi:hypothetical protein
MNIEVAAGKPESPGRQLQRGSGWLPGDIQALLRQYTPGFHWTILLITEPG